MTATLKPYSDETLNLVEFTQAHPVRHQLFYDGTTRCDFLDGDDVPVVGTGDDLHCPECGCFVDQDGD